MAAKKAGTPPGTLESEYDRRGEGAQVSGIAPSAKEPDTAVTPEHAAVTVAAPLPRIEDDGVIGRGGMGAVHRVYDRNIRRFSAMKVIDAALAADAVAKRRFLAEAQITGQLEHPNIVPVYDLEVAEGGEPVHFTMRLVQGDTLASLVRPGKVAQRTLAELWDLLNVFLKLCDAVAYAHSRGVVHRDLKPENVMIGPYGQVYVMDWGIARACGQPFADPSSQPAPELLDSGAVRAPPATPVSIDGDGAFEPHGTILGTPQYMAPEQAWGRVQDIDARTDVFALGAILYTILTGRPPYRGSPPSEVVRMARAARIRPPEEVAPEAKLSPALCEVTMKAMRAAREDRHPSVAALKRDVERVLRGGLWLGTRTFAAGTVILREGDPSDAAYIITKGRCSAFRTEQGEQRKLRDMGPGDVFGEMALLSSRPRSASVVALDDVTAIVVTREVLEREIPAESWLLPLLRTLVDRFRELDEATRR